MSAMKQYLAEFRQLQSQATSCLSANEEAKRGLEEMIRAKDAELARLRQQLPTAESRAGDASMQSELMHLRFEICREALRGGGVRETCSECCFPQK